MAIQINVDIEVNGVEIVSGAITIPTVTFQQPVLGVDGGGNWDGTKTRSMNFQLPVWGSKALFQELNAPFASVDSFPPSDTIRLTDLQYAALTPITVQELIIEWLEQFLGPDTCEIIDPYTR